MMKSEFTDRTNYEPTGEEYDMIENAYYISDLNKDDFCKEWLIEKANGIWEKKIPLLECLDRILRENARTERALRVENNQLKDLVKMQEKAINMLQNEWLKFAE